MTVPANARTGDLCAHATHKAIKCSLVRPIVVTCGLIDRVSLEEWLFPDTQGVGTSRVPDATTVLGRALMCR
jgi:hypothetical protein